MDKSCSDLAYFSRRSSEELLAAQSALDSRARQTHLDLAERYADRARELASMTAARPRPDPVPAPLLHSEFQIIP